MKYDCSSLKGAQSTLASSIKTPEQKRGRYLPRDAASVLAEEKAGIADIYHKLSTETNKQRTQAPKQGKSESKRGLTAAANVLKKGRGEKTTVVVGLR